jgi:3-phosphoshikimate 1-carboxyvinyltransferase
MSAPSATNNARITINSARRLRGEITVPGDKALSHRAVIFNSIGEGTARITNFLPGEDCLSSIACMRQLGVQIEFDEVTRTVVVHGKGLRGLEEAGDILNAGNSGTTMRFLAGLLSGFPFQSVITGDGSLRSRPMKRVLEPLALMGANLSGRKNNTLAPLVIRGGNLKGFNYALPVASAQLKTCLLLAALYAEGDTTLSGLIESRDHTERFLTAMGAPLEKTADGLVMHGPATSLKALDVEVPGDISSAAFWLVAASVHPDADLTLRKVGVNETRTGIIDALLEMGADITYSNETMVGGEPVADLRVKSARLRAGQIGGSIIPRLVDEIPALAVAALMAHGTSEVRDASELRVKETDRIAAIASEFGRLGISVDTRPDGLAITGPVANLKGNLVKSYGDHRLAMALAVAGLLLPAGQSLEIEDYHCADVSYPGFWDDLGRIVGR